MGKLWYGDTMFTVDDGDLRYVQIATEVALGQGQGFALELVDDGRFWALYIAPGVPLGFEYDTPRHPKIDPALSKHFEERAAAGQALQMWANDDDDLADTSAN